MSKKVYIEESSLMDIKNAMAGNNVSHSTFMSEDTPPYEEDEFEIGGEGGNNDFFHISKKRIIKESQESKSISAAKRLVMQRLGYDEKQADEFVRIKLRNDLPSLKTPEGGKFILGVTRMFCDGEIFNAETISSLDKTIKLVASNAHINEYDRDLNGLSAQNLISRFETARGEMLEKDKEEIASMTFEANNDYKIERIDSFEQSSEYGDYTEWCITHDEEMFESYTSNGINQFYFCLKHGFEFIEPQESKGCPLDEYGLSMIAVSVDGDGALNTCTCRWNHDNGGSDSIMDTKQISTIIGQNFYTVFKPNTKWKDAISSAMERIANGEDPRDVFEECYDYSNKFAIDNGFLVVSLCGRYNFINANGEILSDKWFDRCFNFSGVCAKVSLRNKYNFFNVVERKLISDQWFDGAGEFFGNIAKVKLNEKYNYIDVNGRLLNDEWIYFKHIKGKFGLFDSNNNLINGQLFDSVIYNDSSFDIVKLDGKYAFIQPNGRILHNMWFDKCDNFYHGVSVVQIDEKYNYLNVNGDFTSDQWFDYADDFFIDTNFAVVGLNKKYNYIDKNGRIVFDEWFDACNRFQYRNQPAVIVKLNGKYNFFNANGKLVSDKWFDYVRDFSCGFAKVVLKVIKDGRPIGTKCNFINAEGNYIRDLWFDSLFTSDSFKEGIARVELNGKYNFILTNGEFISDQWFDYSEEGFKNGYVKVGLNGQLYNMDKGGNLQQAESKAAYGLPLINEELSQDLIKFALEQRPDKYSTWAVINPDAPGQIPFYAQKKSCAIDFKRWYGKGVIVNLSKYENLNENIEAEVEASEVKLDSFKKNDTLAPRIWDGFDLNPKARLKLLDIADDFWDFVNITWVKRKGIHLTGSICNFNWSKFSDIDLHLVVDFSEIDERKDFVQEYFDAKKNEWNNEHSNLKIFGYPVELYVEDVNAETASGGLYDLEENDWIKKPSPNGIKSIGLDKYEIKNKSADLMTKIDDLYDAFKATNDDAELREIGRKAHKLRDKIKKMRKFGLDRGGESDSFNIIYKVLRRAGYMDMLWDLSSELYDKLNSIDEIKDDKTAGIILEYLESNHNLPLYKYFEWAKNATDEDKARDLMYQCPDTAVKYLETRNACMCDDLAKLRIEFRKSNEVIYDEDFVNAFARGIAKNGLLRDLDFFMRYRGDFYELPSWMTMEFNRIVKNEWCIHFCFDAYSIAREGFKWGTDDIGRLALTGAGLKKPAEGYNFAFPIGERHIDRNTYGSINPVTRERGSQEAVIFQTSGVEVYHEGDEQNQVVFWGPNAKNFIPIKYDREVGDWCIYGNKGQVLKSGSPSEILNWVLDNLPQYRKQIMVGKNGVNLKEEIVADGNPDHNPFKKRWKHEREVLKDYIVNYGEIMTSKENGKEYKVLYDTMLSSRLGINYCICIQWDSMTMEPGNVIYVRAFDKFTRRRFKPEFDTRGFDNIEGTADDLA